MYNNPYPHSLDNKRYCTINYYFKTKYGCKVAKIPLHAGFTCPNRDGSKSSEGCLFCSGKGSGDSIVSYDKDLFEQYERGLQRVQHKWPDCKGFAYFQAFSNTYGSLERIKDVYEPFYRREDVFGICAATRADCLNDEIIDYFARRSSIKETWLEIGLQSIHEITNAALNRCHSTQIVWDILDKLKDTPVKTCIHIINGLPGESKEDMLETIRELARHPFDAIKIHMLHIIQNAPLAAIYQQAPFPLLTLEEYADIVVSQLELLPEACIVERITGDGMADDLIAPLWTIKKTIVANEVDKLMVKRNTWQGKRNGN